MHSHSSFDGFSQFTCISCVFVCFSFATPNISSIYVIAPTYADGAAAGPTNKTSRRRDDKMDFRRTYASCIDRANRNKEHDEKERAKNAEAQSVRFTFDDVNIDGLHYSILIRRAGEAKCAFISTTEKTKLDFSEDMVFFVVASNSVCGIRSVPNTESCLFHLSMQRRQMQLRRVAAQLWQPANKNGT